ncbi:MAG: hypothetical protein M3458_06580 [Acidobacteriota bacterium]|nr:hypothetical protein [Acidobacteriota bacterium]
MPGLLFHSNPRIAAAAAATRSRAASSLGESGRTGSGGKLRVEGGNTVAGCITRRRVLRSKPHAAKIKTTAEIIAR